MRMRNFKGTKGNWRIKYDNVFKLQHIVMNNNNSCIALINTNYCRTSDEGRANANIISAAPDMLELLNDLIEDYEDNEPLNQSMYSRIKSIINKATNV